MKLLFDENLSPRLARTLIAAFPGSSHVRSLGLRGAADHQIWEHAKQHGFVITSKDNDFRQMSFLAGPPPKVVWLDVGNAGTTAIEELLTRERAQLEAFERDPETALIVLTLA